jgi:D-arginine dehydrogenase
VAGTNVVVVGGGIAGVSAAAWAATAGASVTLLEREVTLSAHTTGRSAAIFHANYGPAQTRRLTLASRAFLDEPPGGFTSTPLTYPRGMLWVGGEQDAEVLSQTLREGRGTDPAITALTGREARQLCPVLRAESSASAVFEPGAVDLDVAALHAGFVRTARAMGGTVLTGSPVTQVARTSSGWAVTTPHGTVGCDLLVDAAGAWGDAVAALAGIAPVGLVPMRRTAATVGLPAQVDARGWPAVIQAHSSWYFRPEGDGLLLSPADETPSEPCDARPRDLDVALALERVGAATTLPLRSVRQSWAGLRTFAPDRELVIGPAPQDHAFLWCVGQGGYGIQTAPAAGRLAGDLVTGADLTWTREAGIDVRALAPSRFSDGRDDGR